MLSARFGNHLAGLSLSCVHSDLVPLFPLEFQRGLLDHGCKTLRFAAASVLGQYSDSGGASASHSPLYSHMRMDAQPAEVFYKTAKKGEL